MLRSSRRSSVSGFFFLLDAPEEEACREPSAVSKDFRFFREWLKLVAVDMEERVM
jgi:hypothetical protein